MSDEYLWDRTGPPDPEIERLERLLAPLRQGGQTARRPVRSTRPPYWLAAAAAVVLAAVGLMRFAAPAAPTTAWQVASLEGTAHVGGSDATIAMAVRTGQSLQTGNASALTLEADQLGQVDLGPDSELSAAAGSRLLLRRGTLHAYIWAPPRQFVVDTPAARAIDLGCEYTVTVNRSGDGLLRVGYGWVAFQFEDRESFIPAGAECVTRRRLGPGIPYYADAPQPLRDGLDRFERGEEAALDSILASARPRDGLTLWHLLTRVPAPDRGRVFDRFAQLEPLPAEVAREGALSKDAHTLDLCWNALNLENTGWWRGWERRW
jgi:hypothetical protein